MKSCKIGPNGAKRLEAGISNCALVDLNLSDCDLGYDGLLCIARAIAESGTIEKLDLSDNNLDENLVPLLDQIISEASSIKNLNLSWNSLHSKEASGIIFSSFIKNEFLEEINLSWNNLDKNSVGNLSKFLMETKCLKSLDISGTLNRENLNTYV